MKEGRRGKKLKEKREKDSTGALRVQSFIAYLRRSISAKGKRKGKKRKKGLADEP